MSAPAPVKVWRERDGRLLRVRLARPKANVLDAEMVAALDATFAGLASPAPGLPYTSIWSRSDSIIVPAAAASIAPAGEDCVLDDLGHLSLLASRRVVELIVARLRADRALAA